METTFSLTDLDDPEVQHANSILRKCVHCGFCTATCPTYVLLGDELDSPRGRIFLIKEMLQKEEKLSAIGDSKNSGTKEIPSVDQENF